MHTHITRSTDHITQPVKAGSKRHHAFFALVLAAATGVAHANPLMGLAGINGVVDAVKRTTESVKLAMSPAPAKPAKPKISLPGADKIERGMTREAVLTLVGEPAQSGRASGQKLRDVYKVPRSGPCAVDQVEITYTTLGGVDEIRQTCGDVTSNENRRARYSFLQELPLVFDGVALNMPRDQVSAILGAPADSRNGQNALEFVDVYVFAGEEALLVYNKGEKLLRTVRWNGTDLTLPRIQRAEHFEAAPSR
jgi:hypothetical protein